MAKDGANPDEKLMRRANEYAARCADIEMGELSPRLAEIGGQFTIDTEALAALPAKLRKCFANAIANAFVVGYGAGYEEHSRHVAARMPHGGRKR